MVSQVVIRDLTQKNPEAVVRAINKFSNYWKLTAKSYPNFVAFPDPIPLFNMLNFLESSIPPLRLASKSWLSESTRHFRRILDPLFQVLCDKKTVVQCNNQQELLFTNIYETR